MREIDVKGKSEEELSQSKSSQEDKLRRKRVSWFSARTWESPPHFIPSRCGDSTTSRCPPCSAWRLRSRIVGAPCFCRPSIGAVLMAVAREKWKDFQAARVVDRDSQSPPMMRVALMAAGTAGKLLGPIACARMRELDPLGHLFAFHFASSALLAPNPLVRG